MMLTPTPRPAAPTVLMVGFLGAGKTTFLRELLPLLEQRGLEPYVIINDYLNARVDASSLAEAEREVKPINGHCICCDSMQELITTLLDMPERPNRVVLIEANGTTDPFSLIEYLMAHTALRSRFSPLLQIGVADAMRWQKRSWHNDLEKLQIEAASHLVLTRHEKVTPKRLAKVRSEIEWLNPRCVEVTPEQVAEELAGMVGRKAVAPSLGGFTAAPQQGVSGVLTTAAPAQRHQLSHGFIAMQLDLPPRVAAAALMRWLKHLPSGVLRVKGVVELADVPGMHFVFQRVDDGGREPTIFPLSSNPVVTQCAVLIGVRLDEEAIRREAAERLS